MPLSHYVVYGEVAMRLIKRRQVAAKLAACIDSTYERQNPNSKYYDPEFPKEISMSPTSRGRYFIEEEVDAYIALKAARRDQLPANPRVRRSPRRPKPDAAGADTGPSP